MKKLFLIISLIILPLLTSCEPQQYTKTSGEVVGKSVTGGRYGDSYYISVSYPMSNGKFAIDDSNVDKEDFDSYHINDKVTIYVNDNGIGLISK